MKLKKLIIQNFLSIQKAELELDNRGLTIITGENKDNLSFDNNGAGKSSIIEAITYVLYGRTIRGLKGDEVVNNKVGKNCKVMLDIEDDDGAYYRIVRYRKHREHNNQFYLYKSYIDITPKNEADFTKVITDIMQMDYMIFTSSIMYSAQSFRFTSATDAEVKQAFDTMLDLVFYTNCLEETKKQLKEVGTKLDSLNFLLLQGDDSLKKEQDTLLEYEQLEKEFIEEHKARAKSLKESIADSEKDEVATKESLKKLNSKRDKKEKEYQDILKKETSNTNKDKLDKFTKLLKELESQQEGLQKHKRDLEDNIAKEAREARRAEADCIDWNNKIEQLEAESGKLNSDLSKLKSGKTCPLCGNKINNQDEHVKASIKELNEKLDKVDQDTRELISKITTYTQTGKKELENKLKDLKDEEAEVLEDINDTEKLIRKCKDRIRTLEEKQLNSNLGSKGIKLELDSIDKEIKVTGNYLKKLSSMLDDYADELYKVEHEEYKNSYLKEKAQENIKGIKEAMQENEAKLKELEIKKEALNFWIQGFGNGGIKSKLLANITPFLNKKANYYLQQLSTDHLEVTLSTVSTLKNGTNKEKFSINVENKDGGNSYNSCSGGEKRRIDIAVNLALQDLLATRSNKKLNIAFYDEVFDTLDDSGVENVINLLSEVSKEKSSVFVITHNNNLKHQITNNIHVIKENGYSRIEEN